MTARHGVVFARVSAPGFVEARMHVVYVAEHGRQPRPFAPLIHYVIETGSVRRLPWQREVATAVRLLLDFLAALGASADGLDTGTFRGFAETLLSGTRHLDDERLRALRWQPVSRQRARRCLHVLTAFLDWMCEHAGRPSINPWRAATPAERLVRLRHLETQRAEALLGHAAYRHRDAEFAGQVREVDLRSPSANTVFAEVRAFDERAFGRLLVHGFARSAPPLAPLHRRTRLRDVLIAILLHGGGLRLAEPFHLFVEDVCEDPLRPGSALVRLFHPEQGRAPEEDGARWRDREHYLRDRWRRLPRTLERGRFRAGWKNLALSDRAARCAFVTWFPTHWGEEFLRLFRLYLRHRPRGQHPFLFASEHPAHCGEPYTVEAFKQAHAHAVRRIGLVPAKARGTSPHGHRHAYGKRLRQAKVDPLFIQRAMHHRSRHSQLVYTGATHAEVAAALRVAETKMAAPLPLFKKDQDDETE